MMSSLAALWAEASSWHLKQPNELSQQDIYHHFEHILEKLRNTIRIWAHLESAPSIVMMGTIRRSSFHDCFDLKRRFSQFR